jgi:hypothetical protein
MSAGSHLTFGDWGGDHADVNATATSTFVSLNCSTGAFAGNVALDASGRFAVNGSWNRSVGPVQLNGNMPAQFSGQVIGNTLTFAIAVNDTIAKQILSLGPVSVVFGKPATGQVCPV